MNRLRLALSTVLVLLSIAVGFSTARASPAQQTPPAYGPAVLLMEEVGGEKVPLDSAYPDGRLYHFTILESEGTYYLWAGNQRGPRGQHESRTQRFESQDGLVWTNRTDTNLVRENRAWPFLGGPRQVIFENGLYEGWESYFYEWTEGWGWSLRYITSKDGITWDIVSEPALKGAQHPSVIREDGVYHMWAMVEVDQGMSNTPEILRYRTSTAGGTGWGDWKTGGEAITVDGHELARSSARVQRVAGGVYQLIYQYDTSKLALATSADGIHFTTQVAPLVDVKEVFPTPASSWVSFDLVRVSDEDWLYFSGWDETGQSYLAVSRPIVGSRPIASITNVDPVPTTQPQPTHEASPTPVPTKAAMTTNTPYATQAHPTSTPVRPVASPANEDKGRLTWPSLFLGVAAVAGAMFGVNALRKRSLKGRSLSNAALQGLVDRARDYQGQIEGLVKTRHGKHDDYRSRLLAQVRQSTRAVRELARRVDRFQQNTLIHQDFETVPKAIRDLGGRLESETDPVTRTKLEQALEGRREQLTCLTDLQETMEQAEIEIEQTVSALGTIYSQFLVRESTNNVADYARIIQEIGEQVRRLQDYLEALREVRLYREQ